jgi:translation elongation factor EF-Tu-like GTPase
MKKKTCYNNKFEFDHSKADFIATLTYKTTEQGGRKTAAKSGYRPQIKFDFEEMQTSGQQIFIDRELVFPGDTVEAEIKIISVDFFANKLSENMEFEFREGATVIGTGRIKQINNEKLKKASK